MQQGCDCFVAFQELLELTGTDIASRMRSIKQAARLTKKIQNLQSTWLEVSLADPHQRL